MLRTYMFILFALACLSSGELKAESTSYNLKSTLVNTSFITKADSVILNLQAVAESGFVEVVVTGKDYLTKSYTFKITINEEIYSTTIRDEIAFVLEVITDIPLYKERLKVPKYQKVYNKIKPDNYIDLSVYDDDDMIMVVYSQTCMNAVYHFVKLE